MWCASCPTWTRRRPLATRSMPACPHSQRRTHLRSPGADGRGGPGAGRGAQDAGRGRQYRRLRGEGPGGAARWGLLARPHRPAVLLLLSNLGLWDPGWGSASRRSHGLPGGFPEPGRSERAAYRHASDAHYLDQIMDPCQSVDLPSRSAAALLAWLRCPDFRLYSRF